MPRIEVFFCTGDSLLEYNRLIVHKFLDENIMIISIPFKLNQINFTQNHIYQMFIHIPTQFIWKLIPSINSFKVLLRIDFEDLI